MKIEIEVPDGFIAGKLVFLEARLEGALLNVVDVSSERVIKEENAGREAILSCICQLDATQTVDDTPVVRCKDCANFRQSAHGFCWCDEYANAITPNDYCSRAVTDERPHAKIPWEAD